MFDWVFVWLGVFRRAKTMKTDLYIKFVLTIIAISLFIISVKNLNVVSTVNAQSQSEIRAAISFCSDLATIRKQSDTRWQIHTYC